MHTYLSQVSRPVLRSWAIALLLAGVLILPSLTVRAQVDAVLVYGRSVTGSVEGIIDTGTDASAGGGEIWYFHGCEGDPAEISITAEGFTPRLDLFGPGSDVPLAGVSASAGQTTLTLTEADLPAGGLPDSGEYMIMVGGRSRSDRGDFELTLRGPIADALTLTPGQSVSGVIRSGRSEEWTLYACAGETISIDMTTGGDGAAFTPTLELYAAADGATTAQTDAPSGATAQLQVQLPSTGVYVVVAAGATRSDRGDYTLRYDNGDDQNIEVGPPPTVRATSTPTNPTTTPTPTASGGNQTRRGTPIPRTTNQPTPTATPVRATPTPTVLMPEMGESAFEVLDVGDAAPIRVAVWGSEGFQIATGGVDGAVRIWNRYGGELVEEFDDFVDPVNTLAFSPDGNMLVGGGDDGAIILWSEENPNAADRSDNLSGVYMGSHAGPVLAVAFSPDGQQVASAGEDGLVLIWDVALALTPDTPRLPAMTLTGHDGPVYGIAYHPDGNQIAGAGEDGRVRLWDPATGEEELMLTGASSTLLSVVYARAGEAIVAGSEGGLVYGWDLTGLDVPGYAPGTLEGHTEWGVTAVVDPGDTWLLTAGRHAPTADGPQPATARVWDALTGDLAVLFLGFADGLSAAGFSPDGDEILFSDGERLLIWPEAMLKVFQAAYGEPVGVNVPAAPRPAGQPTPTRAIAPTPIGPDAQPTAQAPSTATPTPAPTVADDSDLVFPDLDDAILDIFCTVITERLNLRPGPGVEFNPPIRTLELGEMLVGVGRNADSSWLLVGVLDPETFTPVDAGWVSAGFVFCVGDLASLPITEAVN